MKEMNILESFQSKLILSNKMIKNLTLTDNDVLEKKPSFPSENREKIISEDPKYFINKEDMTFLPSTTVMDYLSTNLAEQKLILDFYSIKSLINSDNFKFKRDGSDIEGSFKTRADKKTFLFIMKYYPRIMINLNLLSILPTSFNGEKFLNHFYFEISEQWYSIIRPSKLTLIREIEEIGGLLGSNLIPFEVNTTCIDSKKLCKKSLTLIGNNEFKKKKYIEIDYSFCPSDLQSIGRWLRPFPFTQKYELMQRDMQQIRESLFFKIIYIIINKNKDPLKQADEFLIKYQKDSIRNLTYQLIALKLKAAQIYLIQKDFDEVVMDVFTQCRLDEKEILAQVMAMFNKFKAEKEQELKEEAMISITDTELGADLEKYLGKGNVMFKILDDVVEKTNMQKKALKEAEVAAEVEVARIKADFVKANANREQIGEQTQIERDNDMGNMRKRKIHWHWYNKRYKRYKLITEEIEKIEDDCKIGFQKMQMPINVKDSKEYTREKEAYKSLGNDIKMKLDKEYDKEYTREDKDEFKKAGKEDDYESGLF